MSSEEGRRRLARGAKVAVPTVAALGAGSAIAVAAIPGEDGSIDGCYNRLTGALRVIDSSEEQCRSLETAIEWNQRGPAGPQGIPGPRGETGAQGPAGPAGSSAILVGGEALTAGTADAFLKIDGVEGESNDAKHKGEIEIESFSFGLKHEEVSSPGGGAGSGKSEFSSFRFHKLVDRSSPEIFQSAAAGQHFKSAVVTFRRRGGEQQEFLKYKFEDVLVSEYDQGGSQQPPLLEEVDFKYSKIEISYRPQNPDGSLGPEIKAGWDLKANKAS